MEWQVESNVALEVLAQYFRRSKYRVCNNEALWHKKLDSPWDGRSRNNENLFHLVDVLQNYAIRWGGCGSESTKIFPYLSLRSPISILDVAAHKKIWNKSAYAGNGRRIRCFLCIRNRNMIRTRGNEILGNVQRAMIIQILSAADGVHSLNSRDCSLTRLARFEFQVKSICRL